MSFKTCLWWEWASGSSERVGESHQKGTPDPYANVNVDAPAEVSSAHASPWDRIGLVDTKQSQSDIKSWCSISFKWGSKCSPGLGKKGGKNSCCLQVLRNWFLLTGKKKNHYAGVKLNNLLNVFHPNLGVENAVCIHTCAHTHTNNNNEQNQKTPENDLSGRKKGEWNSPHFASISVMKFLQMNKLFLKVLRTIILHYMPTHRLHLVQNNILVFARFSKETK